MGSLGVRGGVNLISLGARAFESGLPKTNSLDNVDRVGGERDSGSSGKMPFVDALDALDAMDALENVEDACAVESRWVERLNAESWGDFEAEFGDDVACTRGESRCRGVLTD